MDCVTAERADAEGQPAAPSPVRQPRSVDWQVTAAFIGHIARTAQSLSRGRDGRTPVAAGASVAFELAEAVIPCKL